MTMTSIEQAACLIVLSLWFVPGVLPQNTIETIPASPSGVLAAGISGLVVRARFERRDDLICIWRYSGELDRERFLYQGFCVNRNRDADSITCREETINDVVYVNSELMLGNPLHSGTFTAYVSCHNGFTLELPRKIFQNCPSTFANGIVLASNSTLYGAVGNLDCVNSGTLFYPNGTELKTKQTTCGDSAQWIGNNELECWKAPARVMLQGEFNGTEGDNFSLTCSYDDAYPFGNQSIFYFGKESFSVRKGTSFVRRSVSRKDNNKIVSCQAITPYTIVYNATGRSPTFRLNVQYAPYQEERTVCRWLLAHTGWCNLTLLSNPGLSGYTITKNGVAVSDFSVDHEREDEKEYFRIRKLKVDDNDGGTYRLRVTSLSFPPTSFFFRVDVTYPTTLFIASSKTSQPVTTISINPQTSTVTTTRTNKPLNPETTRQIHPAITNPLKPRSPTTGIPKKISATTKARSTPSVTTAQQQLFQGGSGESQSSITTLLIVVCIVLAMIIIVIVGVLVYKKRKKGSKAPQAASLFTVNFQNVGAGNEYDGINCTSEAADQSAEPPSGTSTFNSCAAAAKLEEHAYLFAIDGGTNQSAETMEPSCKIGYVSMTPVKFDPLPKVPYEETGKGHQKAAEGGISAYSNGTYVNDPECPYVELK